MGSYYKKQNSDPLLLRTYFNKKQKKKHLLLKQKINEGSPIEYITEEKQKKIYLQNILWYKMEWNVHLRVI